jgi:hypothetical protein
MPCRGKASAALRAWLYLEIRGLFSELMARSGTGAVSRRRRMATNQEGRPRAALTRINSNFWLG